MIQAHTAYLKLINKSTQGGTVFSSFLPRDPYNPALAKQNYTTKETEKASESKDRFSISIRGVVKKKTCQTWVFYPTGGGGPGKYPPGPNLSFEKILKC